MSDKQLVEKELLQFMFQKEDQQRRKLMASNNSLANQVKNPGEVNIGQRNMLMQAKSDVMDGYQMQSMLNFPEYGRANVNIPRAEVLNMHQTPMNAFINQKASTSMYLFLGSSMMRQLYQIQPPPSFLLQEYHLRQLITSTTVILL